MEGTENMARKKMAIIGMASLTRSEGFTDNKLIVLTAAGTLMGKLFHEEPDGDRSPVNTMIGIFNSLFKDEAPAQGNDGYFILTDVEIRSGNVTTNSPFFVVFYDQVIAVSAGCLS